jgi:sigma-B regulation protein RsbU (phosphoserine phosphatase)
MSKILLIDDDPTIQILLTKALSKHGYEVMVAKDGLEGLNLAKEIQPALIICDWLMPKLSGLEVCREVKQISSLETTFFILATSRVAIKHRVEGLDAGADDFICKPIDLQELEARVRAGLRLHQLSEDLKTQKQRLETELNEAAGYVKNLLPPVLKHHNLQIDFRFIPSLQLGGDIFDYFFLDEDNLIFYLLDVSGHGLSAALTSVSIANLFRTRSLGNVNYTKPSEVLFSLNNYFQMTTKNDKYFTIWYGVYNFKNHQLTFSSAGHPPCIAISSSLDESSPPIYQSLRTRGVPIGMFPKINYEQSHIYLSSSTDLYLFSDGIYEINNEQGKFLGLDNFMMILKYNRDLHSILKAVSSYNQHPNFSDDLSIMKLTLTMT